MPDAQTTLFFNPNDPAPIARTMPFTETGRLMLVMPGGVTLHGDPDPIRAWLQAGLDALSDGTVHWGATEARVVPEHPSVTHSWSDGHPDVPLCGTINVVDRSSGAGADCPLCIQIMQDAVDAADREEGGPDAA
jgi:hypothetical protein